MFLVFQIPIVDLRLFSQGGKSAVRGPNWRKPDVGSDFLQGIGGMKPRNLGGNEDWIGESYFCSCDKWLKYPNAASDRQLLLASGRVLYCTPLFRRWLSDGSGVVRLELAWRIHIPAALRPLTSDLMVELLHSVTSLQVRLKRNDEWTAVSLIDLRKRASSDYEYATTSCQFAATTRARSLVEPGIPIVYFEHLPKEVGAFPAFSRKVVDPNSAISGITTASFVTTVGGREVRGWLTERSYQDDAIRQFRINLLRLHAELEALDKLTVSWEQRDQGPGFAFNKRALRDHFERASAALAPTLKASRKTAAFQLALRCYDAATEGKSTHILNRMRDFCSSSPADPIKFLSSLAGTYPIFIMNGQPISTSPAVPTVVYNVSGPGARVNVNSNDSSVNVVTVSNTELFDRLRKDIETRVPEGERAAMLTQVNAMQTAGSKSALLGAYGEFVKLIAAHATVFSAYIPGLTQLLS